MKTQSICLTLAIVLLCPIASAQWVQTIGPYSGKIWSLAICDTYLFAATNDEGAFRSSDNGATWAAVNNGLTNTYVNTLAVSGTNLFAGTDSGVFYSTNNGTSWTAASTGLPATYIRALAVSNANLLAGTGRGVFRSTNNGTTWTAAGLSGNSIYAVAVSGTDLWAASRTGSAGVAYRSANNGVIWTGYVLTSGYVNALAVSGANLFAGSYSGVHRTSDNGISWTLSLTSKIVYSLAVSGTNLFAGTYGGVSLSTDNGTSWREVSTGLTDPYVNALAVCGTNLFAGTDAGVWKRQILEMVTSAEGSSPDLPTHVTLEQNYPNPFNPSTTIRYETPRSANVSLRIFNTLGQLVATLVDEHKEAGYHHAQWNANVPSGIYFYRLQAGEFVETKKMILLR